MRLHRTFVYKNGSAGVDAGETPMSEIYEVEQMILVDDTGTEIADNDPLVIKTNRAMADMAEGRTLNIGYGMGYVNGRLKERGIRNEVCEMDPDVFTIAGNHHADRMVPEVDCHIGRYQTSMKRKRAGTYDTIIADVADCGYGWKRHDEEGLAEIRRLLKPGGFYILYLFWNCKRLEDIPDIPGFTLVERRAVVHRYNPNHEKPFRRAARRQNWSEERILAHLKKRKEKDTVSNFIGKFRKD